MHLTLIVAKVQEATDYDFMFVVQTKIKAESRIFLSVCLFSSIVS